jgi:hypothetical protein
VALGVLPMAKLSEFIALCHAVQYCPRKEPV